MIIFLNHQYSPLQLPPPPTHTTIINDRLKITSDHRDFSPLVYIGETAAAADPTPHLQR